MMANAPPRPRTAQPVDSKTRGSSASAANDELPPFPAVADALLRLTDRDDVGLAEVSSIISTDAVVSAELLRVANTAAYAIHGEVSSILHASSMLGLKRVAGIAVAVALRGYLGQMLRTPAVRRCWRHSLATALTAEEVARILVSDPNTAYTAGLLHDVGRLALIVRHRSEYTKLLTASAAGMVDLRAREREQFGIDHCEAGRAVLLRMDLPPQLVEVAEHHHAPPEDRGRDLLALVSAACALSRMMGFAVVAASHDAGGSPPAPEDPPDPDSQTVVFGNLPPDDQQRLLPHLPRLVNVVTTMVGAYDRALP